MLEKDLFSEKTSETISVIEPFRILRNIGKFNYFDETHNF